MSVFSSGKKWKNLANQMFQNATQVQDYQGEVEFRRQMLANIRQERIARAQLEARDYSTTARSSTNQGFIANIDSSLAGETYFSYASSDRAKQIRDYNLLGQQYAKKYKKQQKTRAAAYAITGIALGALTGGAFAAFGGVGAGAATTGSLLSIGKGAMLGAQIGQGVGQIASGTGQTQLGIQNIINSVGYGIGQYSADKSYDELIAAVNGISSNTRTSLQTPAGYNRYEAISLDNNGKMMFNNAEQFLLPQLNGTTVKAVRGCYNA